MSKLLMNAFRGERLNGKSDTFGVFFRPLLRITSSSGFRAGDPFIMFKILALFVVIIVRSFHSIILIKFKFNLIFITNKTKIKTKN
jgi:hypothetical protein